MSDEQTYELPTPVEGKNFELEGITFFWREKDGDGESLGHPYWEIGLYAIGGDGMTLSKYGDLWLSRQDDAKCGISHDIARGRDVRAVLQETAKVLRWELEGWKRWQRQQQQVAG